MATKTIIELVCEGCGAEVGVTTHTLQVDKRAEVETEACGECWDVVEQLVANGRNGRQRRSKVA